MSPAWWGVVARNAAASPLFHWPSKPLFAWFSRYRSACRSSQYCMRSSVEGQPPRLPAPVLPIQSKPPLHLWTPFCLCPPCWSVRSVCFWVKLRSWYVTPEKIESSSSPYLFPPGLMCLINLETRRGFSRARTGCIKHFSKLSAVGSPGRASSITGMCGASNECCCDTLRIIFGQQWSCSRQRCAWAVLYSNARAAKLHLRSQALVYLMGQVNVVIHLVAGPHRQTSDFWTGFVLFHLVNTYFMLYHLKVRRFFLPALSSTPSVTPTYRGPPFAEAAIMLSFRYQTAARFDLSGPALFVVPITRKCTQSNGFGWDGGKNIPQCRTPFGLSRASSSALLGIPERYIHPPRLRIQPPPTTFSNRRRASRCLVRRSLLRSCHR